MTFDMLADTTLRHPAHILTAAAETVTRHAIDDDDAHQLMQALGLASYETGARKTALSVDGEYVRRLYREGQSATAIARKLGISRGGVWHHIHQGQR